MEYFGCLDDGRLVADTPADLARHLGHRLVTPVRPTWWGRVWHWTARWWRG